MHAYMHTDIHDTYATPSSTGIPMGGPGNTLADWNSNDDL